ncbi:MAG: type II toxin-antitoxin system RelE/ParE family toxin [Proteobacteria bacterium]|nr:MAG: type II toxin-antitoxin system RelE/ParE family toxin [Pseudomonadota bacterium]
MEVKVRPPVKRVVFSNKASEKAFLKLPDKKARQPFSSELHDVIAYGIHPTILHDTLFEKVVELKVNGSPAFRCAYIVLDDVVVVLHSFAKTSQGPDRQNLNTVKKRLKKLDRTQFC